MTARSDFNRVFKALTKYLHSVGIKYRITSAYRSREKQAELGAAGGPYPVAAPGRSQHQYGLAKDMVVAPAEYQSWVGQLWAQAGYGWNASDPVHFAYFTPQEWAGQLGQVEVSPDYFHGGGPSGLVGNLIQGGYQGMPVAGLTVPGSTAGAFSRPAPVFGALPVLPTPSIASRGIAVVDTSPGSVPVPPAITTTGRNLTVPGQAAGSVSISPGGRGGPGGLLSTVSTLPTKVSIATRGIAAP